MRAAIIPARGGSKRIPRKNVREFCGKPMIAWSINAALESECFDQVVVSTDDDEIAEVAVQYGADTPFMRPEELADDYATTGQVMSHAVKKLLEQYNNLSSVCCLYATAPFVSSEDLQSAANQLEAGDADFVFSATSFPFPTQRAIRLDENLRVEMLHPEHLLTRSQDLEETYHDAGQFYWGRPSAFLEQRSFFSKRSEAFLIPRHRVQDIDTPEDWILAELMLKALA